MDRQGTSRADRPRRRRGTSCPRSPSRPVALPQGVGPVDVPEVLEERVAGTFRRECLDHPIPLDERHLRTVLAEDVDYCARARPHRALRLETPLPATRAPTGTGAVAGRPVLGGLHYTCARAA
jgi:hypothetical protein